jgi:predicted N-acyltransferase
MAALDADKYLEGVEGRRPDRCSGHARARFRPSCASRFRPRNGMRSTGAASPFVRHEFLAALRTYRHASERGHGWTPAHLVACDDATRACSPPRRPTASSIPMASSCSTSAGPRPTRVGMALPTTPSCSWPCPFTPITGPAAGLRPGPDAPALRAALIGAPRGARHDNGLSSAHALSVSAEDREAFDSARLAVAPRLPVPLAQPGLRRLRVLPRQRSVRTSARRRSASAAASPRPASRFEHARARDRCRATLGFAWDLHARTFLRHGHEPYLNREFFARACARWEMRWCEARAARR